MPEQIEVSFPVAGAEGRGFTTTTVVPAGLLIPFTVAVTA